MIRSAVTRCLCVIAGKLGSDSVSNHQVSRVATSANGNIFTSQFGGGAAGTPLRGTISIKLSSQSGTAAALRASNTASSLAVADGGDNDETNSSPRRSGLISSSDSSNSPSLVTLLLLFNLIVVIVIKIVLITVDNSAETLQGNFKLYSFIMCVESSQQIR